LVNSRGAPAVKAGAPRHAFMGLRSAVVGIARAAAGPQLGSDGAAERADDHGHCGRSASRIPGSVAVYTSLRDLWQNYATEVLIYFH
jgi:hypothetical protein